jgi:hypothetical protein
LPCLVDDLALVLLEGFHEDAFKGGRQGHNAVCSA